MIIVLTLDAERDFERIGDYIALHNPARAESFVDELVLRCQSLAEMPLRHPLVPGHEESGIRRMPHGNYLIYYRVIEERIDVLHILNAAQDQERVLFPDDV